MRSYFNFPLKSKVARDRGRFNLDLPVFSLRDDGTRVLVVVNRVPQEDIDAGGLFKESLAGKAMHNIILYADERTNGKLGELAYINFHEFRVHDLDPSIRRAAEADFTYRIEKFVKKFKPDVIIAMGEDVTRYMLNKDKISKYFGRLTRYPKNKKIKFIYTLGVWDFCPDVPFEKRKEEGKKLQSLASLTGIVARHFEYAIRKKNLFTLDKSDFAIEIVDTMGKFKRMMRAIEAVPHVAIDSETDSLARVTNNILTLQFAIDGKKSWILPFLHPEAKWTPKQFRYIKKRMKKYFEGGTSEYHLFQNGKFDIGQLKAALKLRHYNHFMYDTSAGEYALEENLKFISDKQMKHLQVKGWGLDFIVKRYGWDAYATTGVDKDSRSGFREKKISDFAKYAGMDSIILFRIRDVQLKRAKHEGWKIKKFINAVTIVLGAMNHIFSEMELNGHMIDHEYLLSVIRPGGKFQLALNELHEKFKTSRAARRVNKKILSRKGAPSKTLFGGKPWEFSINKPDHQQLLFIEELGLQPLSFGKSGKASVGKAFIAKYGDVDKFEKEKYNEFVEEVGWYGQLKKSSTIKSNFLIPIWDRFLTDPDVKFDHRLRSYYNFLQIITGRSGSSNINFQNIPSHGPLAKLVKRIFIPRPGCLYVKTDYSAHEVRNWANISGDDVMGGRFVEALKLKRNFILSDREAKNFQSIVDALKTKGDIHIQNVKFFFGEWVDKKHPLRQKIKAVVFGVIYGKGAFSLAVDLNGTEQEAKDLIDKLFSTFRQGGDWLQNTMKEGRKNYIIESPFGLKRHLWGHMVPDNQVQSAMDRRGPNCLDLETECLTAEGWKTVDQLRVGEYIYTKNIKTGALELQVLKEVKRHKYKGKMWRLTNGIDALATPNHRWLVDWGKGGSDANTKYSVIRTSEELADSGNNNPIHLVADTPISQRKTKWTDEEASIVGWVLTDGHYEKNKNRVRIAQSERGNPHKVAALDTLLPNAGRTGPDHLGKVVWTVPVELGKRIRSVMPDKVLTGEFLQQLSTQQLINLYDAMMLGNGSVSKNNAQTSFCAGTKAKADMFTMLCVMLGIPCNMYSRKFKKSEWKYASMDNVPDPQAPCWYVTIKKRKYCQAVSNRGQWEDFDGEVWCPNVQNSTFIARRNGSVYVTGNTIIQGVSSQMGYLAGRLYQQLKWDHFYSKEIPLVSSQNNAVHDSLENESSFAHLPINLYLTEHSMTTQLAKLCEEKFNFKLAVDLDCEFEIGGSLSAMDGWSQRYDELEGKVENTIKFLKDELKRDTPKSELRKMRHNIKVISDLRDLEIRKDLKADKYPSTRMMFDDKVLKELAI